MSTYTKRTVEPDEDPVNAPIPTDGERCTCGELLDWNDQKGYLDCPKCTPFTAQVAEWQTQGT